MELAGGVHWGVSTGGCPLGGVHWGVSTGGCPLGGVHWGVSTGGCPLGGCPPLLQYSLPSFFKTTIILIHLYHSKAIQ